MPKSDFILQKPILITWSGYHYVESGSPSASPGRQQWNMHTNFKEVLNFLVAKLGYQQLKSDGPSATELPLIFSVTYALNIFCKL